MLEHLARILFTFRRVHRRLKQFKTKYTFFRMFTPASIHSNMAEVEYAELEISTMLGDGSAEMIRRAIDWCQYFDEEMPEEEQERVKTRDKLVTNLVELAKATGSQDILATTIGLAKELYELDATAGDNMLRSYRANNYAVALAHRYWLTGQPDDLHESTRLSEDAVSASSQAASILRMPRGTILSDPGLEVHTLNTLAARLDERFQLTGSLHDLNRSIEIMELLVAAIPWEEWRPVRAEWLDQAIHLFREAREATSEEDPDGIEIRVNLAMRLFQKSDITDVAFELRSCNAEAIEVAASTLDSLPDDHPARAHLHNLLGLCYYARYSHSYSPLAAQEAAEQAVEHLEEALRCPHYPSLFRRVQAGRMMLHLYCSMAKWKKAYETAIIAVEMIPKLSSRSIRNSDKQRLLSAHDVVGFGAEAAAAALNAGLDGYASLRLLEMGRGSLAASVAEMRPDLVALRRDHPALAETFHSLRDNLQTQSPRQHSVSEGFDALLREIRNEPGFERFLEPPSEQEVRDAAQDGPIIMLNASQFRDADAILIESDQIRVLSLRGVTLNSLHDWSSDLKSPELLKWLWDFIARPVLDALQIHLPLQKDSTSTRLPRIWWIPTGILSRFPFHAAGVYTAGFADSVMDRAVSSYSSSIKALNAGRRASFVLHPAESKSLLVEMPQTPRCSHLTYVTEEIQTLQAMLMSKGFNNMVLASQAAQKKDVLKALESCHIFHFAGHGTENVSDPLRSALLLNDWEMDPMTVDSVLNVDLSEGNPFLAYLAACETGQVTASRFYDESIHLIGAYQLAGFRHVIGTLWSVDDHGSVLMATGTYEGLLENMADDSVSRSLHNAARRLRDDSRRSREGEEGADVRNAIIISEAESTDTRWIPFVHFGL